MRKIITLLVFINLPLLIFSKSFIIKTAYDSYHIDEISQTMIYTDDITKKKSKYRILEVEFEPNSGFKLIATFDGEDYLFDVYSINGVQYITKYHRAYPVGSKNILFDTPSGKINFTDFYDFQLRNIDDDIESLNLTGDAARGFREELIKYLEGIKSGNITKFNSDNSFNITDGTKFKDYRNWNPQIAKANWWGKNMEGKSDKYIQDVDYGRNEAIGFLIKRLKQWSPVGNDFSNKQWIKIIRSEIKSIYDN